MKGKKVTDLSLHTLLKTSSVFLLLLFINFTAYSQTSIQGVVKDSLTNKAVFNATVQILDVETDAIIAYSITDGKGAFSNTIDEVTLTQFRLKINHLGYTSFSKIFKSPFPKLLEIELSENLNALDAVTLEIKNEFNVKKDTISFNLEKVRDSSEVVLKDLVNKLPGITIDENKKLEFQGQKIDKVLIDGNDFFGKKHEMATENIPADAVAGIDLLTNHKDFDQLNTSKKNGKIVLNISLHKDFKGKIIGNIDANYGAENRYLFHTNLFNFSSKGNVAFVSDLNNTGESAVNILDFIELKGGIEAFIDDYSGGSGTYAIDESKFPRYVLTDNKVDTRSVNFNSINFTRSFSEKTKFNGYVIFDKTEQTELQFLEKNIFSATTPETLFENQNNNNDNFLINSYFNVAYKPSQDQSFKYQLKVNSFNVDNNLNVANFNGTNFDIATDEKDFGIGQSLTYKQNLSNKLQLNSAISYDYKKNEDNENIISNNPFLDLTFNANDFSLLNTFDTTEKIFNQRNTLSYYMNGSTTFGFLLQYNNTNVTLDNVIDNSAIFNTDITRKISLLTNQFSVRHRFKNGLGVNAKLNTIFSNTKLNEAKESYVWFNPKLNLEYKISNQKKLSIGYGRTTNFIGNQYIFENQLIKNYQTIITQVANDPFLPIISNSYNLQYSTFRQARNSLLTLGFRYSENKDDLSFNTLFTPNNTVFKDILRADNKTWEASLNYSRPFFKLPFRNKYKITYTNRNSENQFDDELNKIESNTINANFISNSKFKNFPIQMSITLSYITSETKNTFDRLNFDTNTFKSSIGLNGKLFKQIFWDTSFGYTKVNTAQLSNEINLLNFNLRYNTKNKRVQFHIKGNNILNIDSNDNISQIFTDSYNQTSSYRLLRGYVMFGMKYDF
ncbi:TonB-dependent receptor [Kordia sp. YSTF-M3]|uniref:TonB-dependent receptor n=1 Tax=Kordia aestuariivivens TaxID=2759037 RepID=A0ABR7Q8E8_9FLAO|nr:TonB-dependent receptor [Kordia aestuariivivens]MBC8754768.1 TonB-dependent receptor [Kordia aestuariivivens]